MYACLYVDTSKKIVKNHPYIAAGTMEVSDNDQIEKYIYIKKNGSTNFLFSLLLSQKGQECGWLGFILSCQICVRVYV